MKKAIFLTIALFFCISFIACDEDSSEEVLGSVKSKHLKNLLSKNKPQLDDGLGKLEQQCPGVGPKLKSAIIAFQECDNRTDDSVTICEAIQKYTLNCTAPLLKVVDGCLPEKARGLPTLGLKSLLSVSDYLCKQTGESIFELANPCLWDEDESAEDDECVQKIKAIAAKWESADDIPTQSEICTSLTSLRSCLKTDAEKSCKNQKTRDVITGVFDALVAPCSHINEV